MSKLRRLMQLSFCDWVILLQLVAHAVLIEILLRRMPLPHLVQLLSPGVGTRMGALWPFLPPQVDEQRASALAALAARIVCGPDCCLPRSLLVFWLLRTRGEAVMLLVGVRKETGALLSHAWVETLEGGIVDGYQGGNGFQPLLRFSAEESKTNIKWAPPIPHKSL